MIQAQWRNRNFSITQNSLKNLQEIGNSLKVKKTSDKTSSTIKIKGFELQEFPIEYEVAQVAGVDPLNEYKTMKSYLGLVGPFLLENTLFGPENVILTQVSFNAEEINISGKVLKGNISLNFKEYSPEGKKYVSNAAKYITPLPRKYYEEEEKAVEDLALKVLYKGTDITDAISVNTCIHDMFASSTADTLLLIFNDSNERWDGWAADKEEIIEVVNGVAKTGKMYIDSLIPENGTYTLRASSIPPTADQKNNKSWENVKFLQLAKEIADRHSLGFESYGIEDQLYSYVRQDNEEDFKFLQKRCELESCAFVVYDQKLVVYSEEYLENQESKKTIEVPEDADYSYNDNAIKGLGKLTIKNGNIEGQYISNNGLSKTDTQKIKTYISGTEEANRFAKGIWRQKAKELAVGTLKDSIMRELSAGSVADIVTSGASSWNGKVFISHVRQDYVNSISKLFFRKANLA